jgi:ribosomal silencing factor RsfS
MVRGHAKAVAQERNQAKAAEKAKSVKREGGEVCGWVLGSC